MSNGDFIYVRSKIWFKMWFKMYSNFCFHRSPCVASPSARPVVRSTLNPPRACANGVLDLPAIGLAFILDEGLADLVFDRGTLFLQGVQNGVVRDAAGCALASWGHFLVLFLYAFFYIES